MRDTKLIAATLDTIRANGGIAHPVSLGRGADWYADDVRLNGQAVADAIADGWLVQTFDGAVRLDQPA